MTLFFSFFDLFGKSSLEKIQVEEIQEIKQV